MIKSDLLKLLSPFIVKSYEIDDGNVQNISSVLQNAQSDDVVFYNINDGLKFEEIFLERLGQSKASLIFINRTLETGSSLKNIVILDEDSFRPCLKKVVDEFYPYDLSSIKLVGITGTNGKTTTAYLAMQIASLMGYPSICIGTLGIQSIDKILVGGTLTTPSYIEFKKYAFKFFKDYKVVFFEFSSHALDQDRLFDLKLDVGGWTNLTKDHLDYHKTMDNYFESKLKLLTNHLKDENDFIISSNPALKGLLKGHKKVESKSLGERGLVELPPFFKAEFNKQNLELALEINEAIWSETPDIDLLSLSAPKGRFSVLEKGKNFIIVDFAHTPDALENIIDSIKRGFPNYKLNILFGCGGDRDSSKRSEMGRVVSKNVENGKIYLTSDNPRFEDPLKIIKDIEPGLKGTEYIVEPERKKAIEFALSQLDKNEILLVAGKGHEEYQDVKGVKLPYSDFKVVEEYYLESHNV